MGRIILQKVLLAVDLNYPSDISFISDINHMKVSAYFYGFAKIRAYFSTSF